MRGGGRLLQARRVSPRINYGIGLEMGQLQQFGWGEMGDRDGELGSLIKGG